MIYTWMFYFSSYCGHRLHIQKKIDRFAVIIEKWWLQEPPQKKVKDSNL